MFIVMQSKTGIKSGFTLVELLVVIAIIGILIALLLPAIQAAREAARCSQCQNNLRQIGLAVQNHAAAQGFFPTGGWPAYVGDPDRGFGKRQPGSWLYNILPYMELQQLHDMGKGQPQGLPNPNKNSPKCKAARQLGETPLAWMTCPTRRKCAAFATVIDKPANTQDMSVNARSDYAGNCGDNGFIDERSLYNDSLNGIHYSDPPDPPSTGVIFIQSTVRQKDITDGLSNTYLGGEKYLNPDHYYTGLAWGDSGAWTQGWDWDNVRRGIASGTAPYPIYRDRPGFGGGGEEEWCFGSAHPQSCNFVFCDSSVHAISYSLCGTAEGLELHRRLANRKDKKTVDLDKLNP
jgi:prepilin-type N-terminal cleavage/methylation domain-containing protein